MSSENIDYKGFTVSMALVDAVPVLLFGGSMILIGLIFRSALFIAGAAICFIAGLLKVLWKLIVAVKNRDIKFMNKQFRILMPAGFAIMIISVIINHARVSFSAILSAVMGMPQLIFFLLWIAGMAAMIVLAKKLDSKVAKNNWIEQCVNGAAQLSLFIALLILL